MLACVRAVHVCAGGVLQCTACFACVRHSLSLSLSLSLPPSLSLSIVLRICARTAAPRTSTPAMQQQPPGTLPHCTARPRPIAPRTWGVAVSPRPCIYYTLSAPVWAVSPRPCIYYTLSAPVWAVSPRPCIYYTLSAPVWAASPRPCIYYTLSAPVWAASPRPMPSTRALDMGRPALQRGALARCCCVVRRPRPAQTPPHQHHTHTYTRARTHRHTHARTHPHAHADRCVGGTCVARNMVDTLYRARISRMRLRYTCSLSLSLSVSLSLSFSPLSINQ